MKKHSTKYHGFGINSSSSKTSSKILPPKIQTKLNKLFTEIEKEFELLYVENLQLNEKLEALLLQQQQPDIPTIDLQDDQATSTPLSSQFASTKKQIKQTPTTGGGSSVAQQQKSSQILTQRLKAQTSKIVSSFKQQQSQQSKSTVQLINIFSGHKDGIWDVTYENKLGVRVIGTAGADHKACLYSVDSANCLLRYQGHSGSVNSIKFHPTRELALTASGDHTAHIWQASVAWEQMTRRSTSESKHVVTSSSASETETSENETEEENNEQHQALTTASLRTPSLILNGHTNVVIYADWLFNGEQLVTASWDRTAMLHDAATGTPIQTLSGHDLELTYCSTHPVQKLIVTTSKDCTFRLWDLRSTVYSVSVFQGHTDTITSAVFTSADQLISGSDDRSVKIWDIRNMRCATNTIRLDSSVNKLSLFNNNYIAIPTDNRNVRIFDVKSGQRICRLPRRNIASRTESGGLQREGHRRLITACTWNNPDEKSINLFTTGFDRVVLNWGVNIVGASQNTSASLTPAAGGGGGGTIGTGISASNQQQGIPTATSTVA